MALVTHLLFYHCDNIVVLYGLASFIFAYFLYRYKYQGTAEIFSEDRNTSILSIKSKSEKDCVIKQGFNVNKVPDNLDAVIIGSGIGGLSAAVFLAKAGKRVLVLEQHDVAGGSTHTFENKGFEFDTGVHYIGEMDEGSDVRTFIDVLTDGQLRWAQQDQVFDMVTLNGKSYPMYGKYEKFQNELQKQFPHEESAIKKFVAMLQEIDRSAWTFGVLKMLPLWLSQLLIRSGLINKVSRIFHHSQLRLDETLSKLTTDETLQTVLAYNYGDLGIAPKDLSVFLYGIVYNHFIKNGAYYPVGGSSEIAYHMVRVIEKHGGKVLVRAPVSQIVLDDQGAACGVNILKGESTITIPARLVISNAGLYKTYKKLIPKEIRDNSSFYKSLSSNVLPEGFAYMSIFVGLKGTTQSLGLSACNHWLLSGTNQSEAVARYLAMSAEEAVNQEPPVIFVSFSSAKDPTWHDRHPEKSVCTAIAIVNYDWFAEWEKERPLHRSDDYEHTKTMFGQQVWQWTLNKFPQLENKVEHFEVGSPLSNNHYLASLKGEIYGMDHSIGRFQSEMMPKLRPQTDVPGLMFTGQDISTAGVVGSMFAGVVCASAALNRHIYLEMLKFKAIKWIKSKLATKKEVN